MTYFTDTFNESMLNGSQSFSFQKLGETFIELKESLKTLRFSLSSETVKSYFSEVLSYDLTDIDKETVKLNVGDILYVCHPRNKNQLTLHTDLRKSTTEIEDIIDQNRSSLHFDLFKIEIN